MILTKSLIHLNNNGERIDPERKESNMENTFQRATMRKENEVVQSHRFLIDKINNKEEAALTK